MLEEIKKNNLLKLCKKSRKIILETALNAGTSSAHIGGALSSVELLTSIFFNCMNYDSNNFEDTSRDRFILSKGHGCLSYYSMLCLKNIIDTNELINTFEKNESAFLGHPVINRKKGIEFSNGSLGMGLSIGIGLAIFFKKRNLKNKIYILIGDGECNEGSIWEGAMLAFHRKLNNIVLVLDKNNFQQTGTNDEILSMNNIYEQWKSFGWFAQNINGHDLDEINKSLNNLHKEKPNIIVANTIKGKGVSFFENDNNWHHASLSQKLFEEAMKEFDND
tara:strand:+ start:6825 stop:7655 length:831 start_codon:yes stop_codon:yes gene_type:complete